LPPALLALAQYCRNGWRPRRKEKPCQIQRLDILTSLPSIERRGRAVSVWRLPCGWIENRTIARRQAEKRRDASPRQTIAAHVLGPQKRIGHPLSYFRWLPLPQEVRADAIAMALRNERIAVSTTNACFASTQVHHAIRLAPGSVGRSTIERSLARVPAMMADRSY
jgi:DNA-binding transcriptional MocR family regulator